MNQESVAVVFPGQGTQRHGMGKDFYEAMAVSRQTYEEASQALGWDVADLCFNDDEKLHLTEYAQPCILATEIAMFRGIQSAYGFAPMYFGGHSLGEYAALVAANALPFADALKTVHIRGKLMQQANPPGAGAMAAVIAQKLDAAQVCKSLDGLPVDVANINSSGQVVISGQSDAMETAEKRLQAAAGSDPTFRFVPLNVSAPFHSRFMTGIKEAFREVLHSVADRLNPEKACMVTSNFSGGFHAGSRLRLIEELVAQINNSVRWRDNMQALAEKAQTIYEIGPNRPLRNFFTSIHVSCRSITSFSAAGRLFA
ncbi:MAG: [acyl-carrier-protein] S-malonyltransferase [Desulfobacteraceae bacterium]|nr:MAG: [acyl-carrier-protein] S-malonyltransferase [Desulfobacteraceae bacterium]